MTAQQKLQSRGVAILMVIAVLAALMAISAPFVFSMIQHERSARNDTSQQTAREGAEGAMAHGLTQLLRVSRTDFVDTSPEVTIPSMLQIKMGFELPEDKAKRFGIDFNVQNPRGQLWSARVEDEQGKLNVNSAPPAMLGNLLASGVLLESAEAGARVLQVDDASQFSRAGGIVAIEGEPVPLAYSSVSSSSSGGSITLEQGPKYAHVKGALVYDGRARLISNGVYQNTLKRFIPYHSIYTIKTADGLSGSAALTPEAFAKIERHITVENGLGRALWGHGERMGLGASGSNDTFSLKNIVGFSPGTLVRSAAAGIGIGYARVRAIQLKDDGAGSILLDGVLKLSLDTADAPPPLTKKTITKKPGEAAVVTEEVEDPTTAPDAAMANGGVYIEPQMKHPINLNTASDEVLAAVFTGVCLFGHSEAVTRRAAEGLTDYLRGRMRGDNSDRPVYATNEDFRKRLYRATDLNIITPPMRDALIINASEPNSSKLRLSTVPFCYFSHGNYTIESSGVANSDTGMQLARHTMRQQFSLPIAAPGRYMIQYQEGFQQLLDLGLADRVVTYPVVMPKQRSATPLPKYAKVDQGSVRLSVGESAPMRGRSSINGDEWFEQCNDERDVGYIQEGYNQRKRHPFELPHSQFQGFGNVASPATGVEMWFRPQSGSQCVFFDEGTESERNRVTFSYEPGSGLTIRIWDSSTTHRTRKPVEFVYPTELNPGDWYHIAGSWKTSQPGGQEIRVDAKPYPGTDPTLLQFKPGGRLGGGLGVDDTGNLTLEEGDGEDFPKSGALKIGEEIIEYSSHDGNSFSGIYRGARMTAAAKHKAGEWVVPFGYFNDLLDDLHMGKGTLVENLDTDAKTSSAKVQVPPNAKPNFVLDSETARIPCDDLSDYPSSGFVLIGNELIYYGAKKRGQSGWELLKLQRGLSGSNDNGGAVTAAARNHRNGAGIRLASVEVSNSADYASIGIVQIDDENKQHKVEWIHYTKKEIMNGKHYLLAELHHDGSDRYSVTVDNTVKYGPGIQFGQYYYNHKDPNKRGYRKKFRNCFGIGNADYLNYNGQSGASGTSQNANAITSSHSKKEKVIPVVRMKAPHCGGWDPYQIHDSPYSKGDDGISEVTIVQRGQREGDLRWVKQAYLNQSEVFGGVCGPIFTRHFSRWRYDFYVGLNDFTTRLYPARDSRFLRWPTGELPDAINAKRHICADKNGEGKVNGDVDELRVITMKSNGARIAMALDGLGIDSDARDIPVEIFCAFPEPNPSNNSGSGNSSPQAGVIVQNRQNAAGSAGGSMSKELYWPSEGLVRIEDELIYYTSTGSINTPYYADVFAQLKDKPPMINKQDHLGVQHDCSKNPPLDEGSRGRNIFNKTVTRLINVQRGVLGTRAVEHPVGAQVMLLDAMPVTYLKAAYNGMMDAFTVSDATGFPDQGYAWINDEVVSWKKRNGNSFTGTRFFRGRFGTTANDHEPGDVVRCLPFRYWDRNVEEYDGEGIAFIQSGYYANNARWFGVDMDLMGTEDVPTRPTYCIPHLLARFDGGPGWDSIPTNTEGGLYQFKGLKSGKGVRFRGPEGNNIRADQMEVRVMWQYLPGAFRNALGADWKRTFSIERMRGMYTSPLIMRRLDEIEKR